MPLEQRLELPHEVEELAATPFANRVGDREEDARLAELGHDEGAALGRQRRPARWSRAGGMDRGGHHEDRPRRRHMPRRKRRRQRAVALAWDEGKGALGLGLQLQHGTASARRARWLGSAARSPVTSLATRACVTRVSCASVGSLAAGGLGALPGHRLGRTPSLLPSSSCLQSVPREVVPSSDWASRCGHPELDYSEIVAKGSPDRPTFFGEGLKETWFEGHRN